MTTAVDWDALRDAAVQAAAKAYAPYSGLQVGAAALTDSGEVVVGCNVENGSYGLTLCAECTMAGQLRLAGAQRLVAEPCRGGKRQPLMPCGPCSQVHHELGGPGCQLDTARGVRVRRQVLTEQF